MKLTKNCIATVRGHPVMRIELENQHQTRLAVLNFGGIMQEFSVVDDHERVNLLATPTEITSVINNGSAINHVIGRVAGVIEASRFVYQNDVWNLPTNYYQHTLNGGPHGLTNQIFAITTDANRGIIALTCQAQEAVDGFPGTLMMTVTYCLTEGNCVHVTLTGQQTQQPGIFAPTLNTYFHLGNACDIRSLQLQVNGSQRLVVDSAGVPTGTVATVLDTPFDFTRLHQIDSLLSGLEITYVVPADLKQAVAVIADPVTKRSVQIYSNRHGLYVGQPIQTGHQSSVGAIALVPQNLPNSVNIPEFGSIAIAVDATKSYDIVYKYIKSK